MIIEGTSDEEWNRLCRIAVACNAVSKETAKKTFRRVSQTQWVPVYIWVDSGAVHAVRVDGKNWESGRKTAYAYLR